MTRLEHFNWNNLAERALKLGQCLTMEKHVSQILYGGRCESSHSSGVRGHAPLGKIWFSALHSVLSDAFLKVGFVV